MAYKSSTPTLEQEQKSGSITSLPATVTGVDSNGQLFRDVASIVFLKGRKCTYVSKFKPSPDSSVMIEIRSGKETWRSNAKVQRVTALGAQQDNFRVAVELDRTHSLEVGGADEEPPADAPSGAKESKSPPATAKTPNQEKTSYAAQETAATEPTPPQVAAPAPSAPPRAEFTPPAPVATAERPLKPAPVTPSILAPPLAPTLAARTMVAEVVRSAVAAELAQLKSELQATVTSQVEAALRGPVEQIEARIAQQLQQQAQQSQQRPALSEESVRKIAAQAAENAQIEWATTSQKIVAETVRSAMASDSEQQRREIGSLVAGEIEAALRGPLGARIDAKVERTIETKMDEHFRKRPPVTEDTVRQLAGQVAESVQLEWVSTKLQKMVNEAVRSALASDSGQRRAEITTMVSAEVDAAVRGPLAARIDATLEKTLSPTIEQHLQSPESVAALQALIADAVRRPLEAEYEHRERQVLAIVSGEIEAAVHGPIAAQMDEILRKALETQREEYLRTPPAITEDTLRQITAGVAEHPQFQKSIDALAANLSERWTEVARGATETAQQDVSSRIAATERLAGQVVADIQQKLNSFSVDIDRILGSPDAGAAPSSPDGPAAADAKERDNRFREVLQSTGSHFEREMKAALQKIFGRS